MGAKLDSAHIFVSREQACALAGVGKDRFQRWINDSEIPTYLAKPVVSHGPGCLPTIFRLADVYAAKRRVRSAT